MVVQVVLALGSSLRSNRHSSVGWIDAQGGPSTADNLRAQLHPVQVVGPDAATGRSPRSGPGGSTLDHRSTVGLELRNLFFRQETVNLNVCKLEDGVPEEVRVGAQLQRILERVSDP